MHSIEKNIIDLMARHDKRFVGLLYDHYSDSLYGLILRIVRTQALAEDVMQDSFVKIWTKHRDFDPQKSRLFTWLLTICRNTAIDKLRVSKRRGQREIHVDDSVVYDNRQVHINPDVMDLGKHLKLLEPKYLDVIEALFFKGMTHQEASEELDIPLGTIKTRFKIAMRELRKHYAVPIIIAAILYMLFV